MSVWVLSIIHDYGYNKTKVKKHYKQRWHCNWDWSGKHLTWISNEPGQVPILGGPKLHIRDKFICGQIRDIS